MKIHIICCNDSPELAVLGPIAKAEKKLKEVRKAGYELSRQYNPRTYKSMADYTNVHFWHIHTTECVDMRRTK